MKNKSAIISCNGIVNEQLGYKLLPIFQIKEFKNQIHMFRWFTIMERNILKKLYINNLSLNGNFDAAKLLIFKIWKIGSLQTCR